MHLMTIENFTIFDINKNIKFNQKNIKNIVHQTGEQYMLNALFRGGEIPSYYYAGLDNRSTLSSTDAMSSIIGEPQIATSYKRQKIEVWNEPVLSNGVYIVSSGYITFSANTVGWGPVSNIFLTTANSLGILISSAKLLNSVTLSVGDTINMTISLSLVN